MYGMLSVNKRVIEAAIPSRSSTFKSMNLFCNIHAATYKRMGDLDQDCSYLINPKSKNSLNFQFDMQDSTMLLTNVSSITEK